MPRVFDYLIIGGGIAGTTAAEAIRQRDARRSIAIVSDEPRRLYSRILLSKPNFFLERMPFDQIWLKTDEWYNDQRIELLAGRTAVKLNAHEKIVELDDATQLHYGKLLLAIGSCARNWPIPGVKKRGVFYLRTLDDAKAITRAVKNAKRGTAIGGGFIGFEMCDMMKRSGLEVTALLRGPHYWSGLLDEASGRMIEQALERGGVRVLRNTEIADIIGSESVEKLRLNNGTELSADIVIVGIGAVCPLGWIAEAGIETNRGIVTNEYLETGVADIWAAGDAAEFTDLILGERIQLGNWVNAQMQGRRAGLNMAASFDNTKEGREPFRLVSFYTTQGFGITIAFVGNVRPLQDRTIITRGTPELGAYARIFIAQDEIVGATLINRTEELGALLRLIERDVKVRSFIPQLQNPSVSLSSLLASS